MKRASYPHLHSRYARHAQQRCAPAVDMTGWGQLLRTCPHPLDNSLSPQRKADISILQKSGHFYFALTRTSSGPKPQSFLLLAFFC
jgi:hypothetical protein